MFARIGTFFYKAVLSKWINIICLPIVGIFLITDGYAFLQDDPGHHSGMFYIISGSIFLLYGVLEWLSHYLNMVGKIIPTVIKITLIISAAALILIA